ncbi:hypothetical protein [Streptomyces ochraceiscleroticus]|uniref:Histidine kinase/HSP90-like ATPase domain-containing protein n=1 Tax=Streptomyces ochraceiscleroticus TaxID=47761 RepID=A0ABW1MRL7_9ACTN|nr:hypothetical protein [Streptomyces ochraceiscleroticus]
MTVDFSWSLTLPCTQISVLLAGRLAGAAVRVLGVGSAASGDLRENVHAAGGYVVTCSRATAFRVVITVAGSRCQVVVTDCEFVSRAPPEHGGSDGADTAKRAMMLRQLSARADAVEVRDNEGGGVLIRFDVQLP